MVRLDNVRKAQVVRGVVWHGKPEYGLVWYGWPRMAF
jgi:hypothetical protein